VRYRRKTFTFAVSSADVFLFVAALLVIIIMIQLVQGFSD